MAFTDKKRKFAAALMSGASNKEAAIAAGYSVKTASQAGTRLAKDPDVLAEIARKETVSQAKEQAKEEGRAFDVADMAKAYSDPADFLEHMMNDAGEDPKLRLDAAKTLMPYRHSRKGEGGKKDAAAGAAKQAANKFAPSAPPKLVVNNKR